MSPILERRYAMNKREIAATALATHDALRAAHALEPTLDDEGMPLDPDAWLRWRTEQSEPAYRAWQAAMADLDIALGQSVGRHPFTFRPLCEAILSTSLTSDDPGPGEVDA